MGSFANIQSGRAPGGVLIIGDDSHLDLVANIGDALPIAKQGPGAGKMLEPDDAQRARRVVIRDTPGLFDLARPSRPALRPVHFDKAEVERFCDFGLCGEADRNGGQHFEDDLSDTIGARLVILHDHPGRVLGFADEGGGRKMYPVFLVFDPVSPRGPKSKASRMRSRMMRRPGR
jgi:hypothetical protein